MTKASKAGQLLPIEPVSVGHGLVTTRGNLDGLFAPPALCQWLTGLNTKALLHIPRPVWNVRLEAGFAAGSRSGSRTYENALGIVRLFDFASKTPTSSLVGESGWQLQQPNRVQDPPELAQG
jgi:hypothetical protein